MNFQMTCLHDALRTDGPAAANVAELIRRMVAVARDCQARSVSLELPANQLGYGKIIVGSTETPLSLLYPSESVYRDCDITALQVRLIRAQKDLAKLQLSLSDRSFSYWVAAAGRYAQSYLKKLR
jgi:hypothetical protein